MDLWDDFSKTQGVRMSTTIMFSIFSLALSDAIPQLTGKVVLGLLKRCNVYIESNIKGSPHLEIDRWPWQSFDQYLKRCVAIRGKMI